MGDEAVWSSPDLRLRGPAGRATGLSLDRSALRAAARGVPMELPLDEVAAVALEVYEDEGLTAFCRITARDGTVVTVTNAGDLVRHRLAYRGFIAALVERLGPERAAAIRFTAGPDSGAGRHRVALGLVGAAIFALWLAVFLLFPQTPPLGGGWWIGVICPAGGTVMMLLLALHQARSRPKPFSPDAVPEDCLPRPCSMGE